jgi:hypothetical protein
MKYERARKKSSERAGPIVESRILCDGSHFTESANVRLGAE